MANRLFRRSADQQPKFDLAGLKVVVAVVDPVRGPVFNTVHPKALSERQQEGANDPALRLLVRRTPPPLHTSARGASAGRKGRSASFTRGAPHRPTGK